MQGNIAQALPPWQVTRAVLGWLEEDVPSMDIGGFVVGGEYARFWQRHCLFPVAALYALYDMLLKFYFFLYISDRKFSWAFFGEVFLSLHSTSYSAPACFHCYHPTETPTTALLYGKSKGILCGKVFFDAVFKALDCTVEWMEGMEDGAVLSPPVPSKATTYPNQGKQDETDREQSIKVHVATVKGKARHILLGERTALNILTRASGIATISRASVDIGRRAGWHGTIAGTRKTTPGFRMVEKYALLVGGAATHRQDLSQMVMLKDNHVWSTGSITKAVKAARGVGSFSIKIEVECQTLSQAQEAGAAGADVIMLDNFAPPQLKETAALVKSQYPHVVIEASGGITTETLEEYFSPHVDVISRGSLTQGYPALDFSLKIVPLGTR